jgi:threonine/homoserine/homoserine lactone efflux protein
VSTLFSTALFLLCVYILGFLAAIPIGASQIEVARRALNGLLAPALIVVAGSVSSDFVYGAIALYGLAPFLQQPKVEAIFWLINAALILYFATAMLRDHATAALRKNNQPQDSVQNENQAISQPRLANRRIAYVTGFSLAFTNPLMIAWWLLAAKFLKDLGIEPELTNATRVVFLLAGCLGIGSYLSLFAGVIHRRHRSFSAKHTRSITRSFGVVMILFAIYFVIRSIATLVTSEPSKNSFLGSLFGLVARIHQFPHLYLPTSSLVSLHS